MNCYIHIPFCTSKCKYCNFVSFAGLKEFQIKKYIDFLCEEIKQASHLTKLIANKSIVIDTIYFGGGTPGILKLNQIKNILNVLKKKFVFANDVEITLEVNPENITKENLLGWEELGINRISIGVQTLNKKSLKEIGREKKGNILNALNTIKDFNSYHLKFNFSLDFIIGLPYVKRGEIKEDIEKLFSKYDFINHISVYMLENNKYPKNWKHISINDEEYLQEYLEIKNCLKKNGLIKYELSNFAKANFECKHNIGYWTHKNYIGFGLGAHSFINGVRFSNSKKLKEYYNGMGQNFEKLNKNDLFFEKLMFDLRTSGVNLANLRKLNLQKINELIELGYLEFKRKELILTDKGILILDYILKEII